MKVLLLLAGQMLCLGTNYNIPESQSKKEPQERITSNPTEYVIDTYFNVGGVQEEEQQVYGGKPCI